MRTRIAAAALTILLPAITAAYGNTKTWIPVNPFEKCSETPNAHVYSKWVVDWNWSKPPFLESTSSYSCSCDDGFKFEGKIGTGFFDSGYSSSASCVQCPGGYWCLLGSAEPCRSGTYCPAGTTKETYCGAGNYCPERSSAPIPCPAGTYGVSKVAPSSSFCKKCPTGFYSPPGSSSDSACKRCPDGYDCSSGAEVECGEGAWCIENVKTLCPKGTASSSTTATSPSVCIQCAAPYYSFFAGSPTCKVCKDGYLCDDTTGVASDCGEGGWCVGNVRYICPVNTYGLAPVMITPESCLPCSPGYTSPEGSTSATACVPSATTTEVSPPSTTGAPAGRLLR